MWTPGMMWGLGCHSLFLGDISVNLVALTIGKLQFAIWDTSFWTFLSNLDTRDLKTYPKTYSGHF